MPRLRAPRPPRAIAGAAALLVAATAVALAATAAGCAATAPDDSAPEPTATLLSAPWTVEPEAAATPTTVAAPLTSGDVQATAAIAAFATSLSATVAALASPAAASEPAVAVNTAVPIAGCGVPRTPFSVAAGPGADAPDAVKSWWLADPLAPRSFDGEVVASDGGGTSTRVRAEREGASFEVTITTDVPLPLSPGRHVHVVYHDERSRMALGGPGIGVALFVGDADGPVALIVASGDPLAAGERLLGGERGGFTIQQLRSPCSSGERECGRSLYAAPVRFMRGAASLTLGPGEAGVLASGDGGPAFDVRVATSHVVLNDLTSDNPACSDWESWVLSYGVVRK